MTEDPTGRGDQGDPGPAGPRGPQGIQGPKGDSGTSGRPRVVGVDPQAIRDRSAAIKYAAVAICALGAAVLLVLLTGVMGRHSQDDKVDAQRREVTELRDEVDRARALEGDVAILKQQLRDLNVTPAVPDRAPVAPPVTTPTTTTTTTTLRPSTTTRPTSAPTTTSPPAPSTPPPPPPTAAPPTTGAPTTTTTQKPTPPTSCVVLGLICR